MITKCRAKGWKNKQVSSNYFCKQSEPRPGLIWIQNVWQSDGICERKFSKNYKSYM